MDEPHVKHRIRFVQDQKLDPLQRQQVLVAQVEQAAGRGHQDVDPLSQLGHLTVLAYAAKNQRRAHLDEFGVGLDVVVNLRCELAGGGQDQHPRHSAAVQGVERQVMDNGKRKRSGFSGSGLGTSQHISTLQHFGNGLRLNGSRLLVAERYKGFKHLRVQPHV